MFRTFVLSDVAESDGKSTLPQRLQAYGYVMSLGSRSSDKLARFGERMQAHLPNTVKSALEKLSNGSANEFPPKLAWVS